MPAFFVALRESVHDPKEMRLYADKAAGSAAVAARAAGRGLRDARRPRASHGRVTSGSCASAGRDRPPHPRLSGILPCAQRRAVCRLRNERGHGLRLGDVHGVTALHLYDR
jgi:hypothetical protein